MLFGLLSTKAKFDGDDTEYIETEQNEYPACKNIADVVGKAVTAYNTAYANYIVAKTTYDVVLGAATVGYFICENLLSDLIGKFF